MERFLTDTMKNIVIIVLAAVVVIVGLYAAYAKGALDAERRPAPVATTTADVAVPQAYTRADIGWKFEDKGEDALSLARQTQVTVLVRGKAYDLGAFAGTCAEANAESLRGDEVAGALCWWAGAGTEFRVVQPEPGRLVIRQREVGEGEDGARAEGEYKTVLSI